MTTFRHRGAPPRASLLRVGLLRVGLAAAVLSGAAACDTDTPSPGASGSVTPGVSAGVPSSTNGPTSPKTLDGTAYYFDSDTRTLWSATGSTATKVRAYGTAKDAHCLANSIVVSPDGTKVAWGIAGEKSEFDGTLYVSSIDGSNEKKIGETACHLTDASWSNDSRTITTWNLNGNNKATEIDVTTGATKPVDDEKFEAVSANGSFRASIGRSGTARTITVKAADGSAVRTAKSDPVREHDCSYTLGDIDDTGRYVTTVGCSHDIGRVLGAGWLFDTQTSKYVSLPGKDVAGVNLVGDAAVVSTVRETATGHGPGTTYLVSLSGKVIAERAAPKGLPGAAFFVQYVPRAA